MIQEISSPDSPEKTEVRSVHDPSGESGPDGWKSNDGLEEEELEPVDEDTMYF